MDNYMPLETDEFIIVGIRHADYADRLAPWFEKGKPMEMANLKEITKTDVVYLTKSFYDHDPNTIGVFVSPEERLGYLWTNQAYAMKEWMKSHKVERVRIRITRISTKHGFMVAKALKPIKLTIRPRESLFTYMDWAKDIPMVRNCWMAEKLNRSILMLEDRLEECDTWSDELWAMTDGVIELLSYDLSTLCFIKGVRLYLSMKDSPIEEVREQSDRLLYTMIHRGSPEMMKWWTEHCLAYYIHEVKNDAGFLKVFECANYTLERVKEVLQQAPDHLFPIYLGKKECFASALYYAALPHEVYTRLLTLLAVYEAMIEKNEGVKGSNLFMILSKEKLAYAIENCQDIFWGKSAYAVVFCICRDNYDMEPNRSAFEKNTELLPFKKKRKYICSPGTISNAFRDNPIYNEHIDKWEGKNAAARIIKLRDKLKKLLE